MRWWCASFLVGLLLTFSHEVAAQQPAAEPAPKGRKPATEGETVALQAKPDEKLSHPIALFSGLDKITGRTFSFEVAINETVQFGALQLTPRTCLTRVSTSTPRTTGYLEVDEVALDGKIHRIFKGWMFASSPGLHAVEHPIYDVWLTGCRGAAEVLPSAPEETEPLLEAAPKVDEKAKTPKSPPLRKPAPPKVITPKSSDVPALR
jgi:hypothetical protein